MGQARAMRRRQAHCSTNGAVMTGSGIKKEERERALKALIRETIANAGPVSPDSIPHRVKERLKGQAVGDLDLDALIREALAEQKKTVR